MKKFICGALFFSVSSLFTLNSCQKNTVNTTPATPLSTIQADPTLTIFSAIEKNSGDDNFVNGSTAIVVPVDSAFIKAGITAAIAATLTPTACDSIVKYYALPNAVSFNGTGNIETAIGSDLGTSVFADSTTTALYFDGVAAVSNTPIIVGTTSIYKLTHFVSLPAPSITQVIAADTSLTLFNEAFNRVNLAGNLTGGSFTLFMPTNAAFIAAGFPDIPSIDNANITTLTQVLTYHVVANGLFGNDIALKSSLTTLQGGVIQVSNTSGLQLLGNSDPSMPASLLTNGIIAGNVLAYKINNVLLP